MGDANMYWSAAMADDQKVRLIHARHEHCCLGRVRDITDKAEPVTGADHFGPEIGETLIGDCTGLEIPDVVRRVVHELHMPDTPPMRLLQPFEFPLEKVETLDIGNNRRLPCPVRRFKIAAFSARRTP